jgi:hypothetical protein
VLVFVTGAIPAKRVPGAPEATGGFRFGRQPNAADIPEKYRATLGSITEEKSIPEIRKFLDEGGTVITIGTSTNLAQHLNLPVKDYMVERTPTGGERELPREKFYIPGSLLRVSVDNTLPIAAGMPNEADVMFDESPVFRLEPDASIKGVKPIAWYASDKTLRSGWAWGQNYLEGGVAAAEASYGRGKVYLFGPEILFRAQPHGTFKFLFNGIYAPATETAVQ